MKRKGFGMLEGWAAIESDTGDAEHREFDNQRIALLAGGNSPGA